MLIPLVIVLLDVPATAEPLVLWAVRTMFLYSVCIVSAVLAQLVELEETWFHCFTEL